MRRTRIESHPCTQPLKEAPPSLSLRSSPPAPTRSRRTPLELLPCTWPLRKATPRPSLRSSPPTPTRSRRTTLELLPYTWPLRRGTPKLPPRSSSPPPEPAARNDSWSTPPKHPSCPARKDVTGRCFSSHPGTTNVLSNSRWTNPKKYCPISLLKVVCLGHDVPALRRACGSGVSAARRGREAAHLSARTLFDGAVIPVFDGRRSPTGTMGAGCRMAVTESSRYAAPAVRFGPSGDAAVHATQCGHGRKRAYGHGPIT